MTTNYTFDTANRLTRMQHLGPAAQALEDLNYGFETSGRIHSIGAVASVPTLPQGTTTAAAADDGNRISQFGSASYSFDTVGQTLSKTDSAGTTQYSWDARGRLSTVTLPNGKTLSYGYDPLGRRASRTDDSGTTSFLYDGADVAVDKNPGGSETEYINGPGIDNKLRQSSPSGSLVFLHDHLGSTIGLTNASGTVVERDAYEPYGNSAGGSMTRYGFTGRERDDATGLIYFRARWYDPQQSRFITEDPVGYGGGANVYAYANGNPVNFADPMGLDSEDHWFREVLEKRWGQVKSAAESVGHGAKQFAAEAAGLLDKLNEPFNVGMNSHPTIHDLVTKRRPPHSGIGPLPRPGSRKKVPCDDSNDEWEKAYRRGQGRDYEVAQVIMIGSAAVEAGVAGIAQRIGSGAEALSGGLTTTVESGAAVEEAVAAGEPGGPATVEDLIDMMNERPNVNARFATGDEDGYLRAVDAAGSHVMTDDGVSDILLREDVATRETALHEWLHRRLQLQNGGNIPGEERLIDDFLNRHRGFFRLP